MPRKRKPPVFRGPDFAMRQEQSRWSEDRIIEAVSSSKDFVAIPYGRSQIGTGKPEEIKEFDKSFDILCRNPVQGTARKI